MITRRLVVGVSVAMLAACQKAPIQPERQAPSASASTAPPLESAMERPDPSRRFIDGVAWSKSGRSLATWCSHACLTSDKDAGESDAPCPVSVWDRSAGKIQATFEVPCAHDLFSVKWSPSEALFGVSDYDSVRIWRIADRSRLIESGSLAMYGAFQFSPDESMMLWGNVFGQVELWALPSGKRVKNVSLHNGAASLGWSARWDASSKLLLLHVEHGEPELWDGRALTKVKALRGAMPKDPDDAIAMWGPDDKSVVLVGTDGLIALFQVPSGASKVLRPRRRKEDEPFLAHVNAELSADKRTLVVMDDRGGVEAVDLVTGKRREIVPRGEAASYQHRLSLAPDGKHFALGREGGFAIGALDEPGVVREVKLPARADAGDRDEPSLLGWRSDGGFLIETKEKVVGVSLQGAVDHEFPAKGAKALSPDGRFLAIAALGLVVIRLSDRRQLTFVLRDVGGALAAKAVGKKQGERVTDADVAAFWGP